MLEVCKKKLAPGSEPRPQWQRYQEKLLQQMQQKQKETVTTRAARIKSSSHSYNGSNSNSNSSTSNNRSSRRRRRSSASNDTIRGNPIMLVWALVARSTRTAIRIRAKSCEYKNLGLELSYSKEIGRHSSLHACRTSNSHPQVSNPGFMPPPPVRESDACNVSVQTMVMTGLRPTRAGQRLRRVTRCKRESTWAERGRGFGSVSVNQRGGILSEALWFR